ncbi:putative histone-arginine methyltransferase 1.3, partial [Sarracenia purpurea var. burkii]
MVMEVSAGQKCKQDEFAVASVSELASSSSTASASPVVARFSFDSGAAELIFYRGSESNEATRVGLRNAQLFMLSPVESVCISQDSETCTEKSYSRGITIQFRKDEESRAFHCAFEQWKKVVQGRCLNNGTMSASKSKFDDKIEASSAKMYFHYYGQLLHQQNMLQDYVRTGTYYAAVIENRADFAGRVVVDVGAGSGILSLFAAQAGAKHVYAVEASEMAEYARKLIAGNPLVGQRITVIKGKIEEVELPEKADILISEPM